MEDTHLMLGSVTSFMGQDAKLFMRSSADYMFCLPRGTVWANMYSYLDAPLAASFTMIYKQWRISKGGAMGGEITRPHTHALSIIM